MLYGKLDVYLWKRQLALVLPIFLVLFVLFFASTLGQLTYDFKQHDLPIHYLPKILLAQSPELILLLIGISLYIGIIVNLSSLNNSQESVIMMAVGLSKAWFLKNVILFVLPFLVIISYLAFFLMPQGFEKTRHLGEQAKAEINLKFSDRTLKTYGRDIMLYVSESLPDGQFKGAVIQSNINNQELFITAKSGQDYSKNGARWLRLYDVMIYLPSASTSSITYAKSLDFSLSEYLLKSVNQNLNRSIRMLGTVDLLQNGSSKHIAEFFWRLSYVISALLFCLLAVFIVRYRPRKSPLINILPALVIFLVYSKLLILVRQNTETGVWSPEFGYGGLYVFFAILLYGMWLLSENRLLRVTSTKYDPCKKAKNSPQ
jgi:lipopolysaccharide export system permease protein